MTGRTNCGVVLVGVATLMGCSTGDDYSTAFAPHGQCDETSGECVSDLYVELLLAVQKGDIATVRTYFNEHGAYDRDTVGVHPAWTGLTPSALAARTGDLEMLKLVLENGGKKEVQEPQYDFNTMHMAIDGWNAARSRRKCLVCSTCCANHVCPGCAC